MFATGIGQEIHHLQQSQKQTKELILRREEAKVRRKLEKLKLFKPRTTTTTHWEKKGNTLTHYKTTTEEK